MGDVARLLCRTGLILVLGVRVTAVLELENDVLWSRAVGKLWGD